MNCGNDLFDKLLSSMENVDNNIQYTELQNVVSPICNNDSQYTTSSNDSINDCQMDINYVIPLEVSLKNKNQLKDLLEEWHMGYLLQTCLGE